MKKILFTLITLFGLLCICHAQYVFDNGYFSKMNAFDSINPQVKADFFSQKHHVTILDEYDKKYTGIINLSYLFKPGQEIDLKTKNDNGKDTTIYFAIDTMSNIPGVKPAKRMNRYKYIDFDSAKVFIEGNPNLPERLAATGKYKLKVPNKVVQPIITGNNKMMVYYIYFYEDKRLVFETFVIKFTTDTDFEIFENKSFAMPGNFYKKMAKFVSDCPELAEKVKAADPNFNTYTKIATYYNNWRNQQTK